MMYGSMGRLSETTLEITELPVQCWTQTYKENVLETMLHGTEKEPPFIRLSTGGGEGGEGNDLLILCGLSWNDALVGLQHMCIMTTANGGGNSGTSVSRRPPPPPPPPPLALAVTTRSITLILL